MKLLENEYIELKSIVNDDICKEIIAFANSKGGALYVGVNDDGTALGLDNIDQVILQINNKVKDNIKPDLTMFISYETEVYDDVHILKINIQKGTERPYYLAAKGLKPSGVYVRNGTSCDPATDSNIRKMIKESDGDVFENNRSLEQNLTFQSTTNQFKKHGLSLNRNNMQTLGIVSKDGVYSNLGFILSDQNTSTIKAAVFNGLDKNNFQDRCEFSGSIFQQMDEAYSYLNLCNKTSATFEGLYRIDRKSYPDEAIRECLLNCIIHREYSYSASTLISVYDDRMEFVTLGGLAEGIEKDDLMLGVSVCRNQKLASIFYRLTLIEAYGTGLLKIMDVYNGHDIKPQIEISSNAFKITLPNLNYHQVQLDNIENDNNYNNCVMDYLNIYGVASRNDIENTLGVSQATANRVLRKMVNDNLIRQEGRGKTTCYKKKN